MLPNDTDNPDRQVEAVDEDALAAFFERHRGRLRRMIALRMDRRVQGRLDPSDVLQDTYLEASERLADYRRQSDYDLFVWLRFLATQKLIQEHRRHLGARVRDAQREISIYAGAGPEVTSEMLAAKLVGSRTSPSQALMRAEMKSRLQEALDAMSPIDREILILRHFERLTAAEAGQVLGIEHDAARKRYLRAVKRLSGVFKSLGGVRLESGT